MKIRSGFISNSSSTSFIIEFDKDKEVSIKLPLSQLLKWFDNTCSVYSDSPEFTEQDIKEKEKDYFWKLEHEGDLYKIKGSFRHSGNGPNGVERLIYDKYRDIEQFFAENEIKVINYYED